MIGDKDQNDHNDDVQPGEEPAFVDSDAGFEDSDRLPWLETGEDYDDGGASPLRTLGIVVGLLILLGLIVGGIYWLQNRDGQSIDDGSGEVIAAPEGDYKVKPDDPEGREFEGEGDVALATADGRADKEAPKGAAAKPGATAMPASASGGGGGLVQLASFTDQASADAQWSALTSRYDYLSSYKKSVKTATIEGRKVYRLNAVTADAASAGALCEKLKTSGVDCLVPR